MASSASTVFCLSIFLALNFSAVGFPYSSSCSPQPLPFLYHLRLQCPLSISSSRPVQMNKEALERALNSKPTNSYSALLFYGSWCSFSSSIRGKFELLSSMYPQIEHIEVEQSSATPSLLLRFGVRSLPALVVINQTMYLRYYGKKDLQSLARFYHKATELDPVKSFLPPNFSGWANLHKEKDHGLWYQASSWKEMLKSEPYLVISILFLILRIFVHLSPQLVRGSAALWNTSKQQLNMGVFGESRQLLGRAMQIIDVKRAWDRLKRCKTRSFHRGARNARVWASSLTSVSLGDSAGKHDSRIGLLSPPPSNLHLASSS